MFKQLILAAVLLIPGVCLADGDAARTKCLEFYEIKSPEAVAACSGIAEAGDPVARRVMGDIHYFGWQGVPKEDRKAFEWYNRAAGKDDLAAKYNVAVMYYEGLGTDTDYNKAFKWFLSAAKDGHMLAQFNTANMYSKGAGIRRDEWKASGWYLRAANQGETLSQYNIGNRFATGAGVEANPAQAYKWYTIAARAGDEDAKKNLKLISEQMNPEDIARGKQLAGNWTPVLEQTQKEGN